jgi:hypothetical protein
LRLGCSLGSSVPFNGAHVRLQMDWDNLRSVRREALDRIRTVNLTSDYRLRDNFGGTNYFAMTWRQGLDIMGPRTGAAISCRAAAHPPISPR